MYPFIHLKNFDIPVYGLCILLGLSLGMLVSLRLIIKKGAGTRGTDPTESKGTDPWLFVAVFVITFAFAFAGAKILYILISFPLRSFFKVLLISLFSGKKEYTGGFVFYGGLIGGILGLFLGCRVLSCKVSDYIEETAVFVPLAHAFGRVGCFFAGCCYGKKINWAFSDVLPRFPVQLVEAFLLLCVFGLILHLYCKGKNHLLVVYGVFYSVIRFVLEFFRGDFERGFILDLSTSQFISICIFSSCLIYSAVIFVIGKRKPIE